MFLPVYLRWAFCDKISPIVIVTRMIVEKVAARAKGEGRIVAPRFIHPTSRVIFLRLLDNETIFRLPGFVVEGELMDRGSRILMMGLLSLVTYLTILYLQFQTPYVAIVSGMEGARAGGFWL